MSTVSFNGLLIISVIAVVAPVLAASVKALKLPSAVVEIVAGIIVGPSVLAWVKIDQPVNVVALLGLAFLLFLAGLEIDLRAASPSQLRAPLTGYAGSLLLGTVAGVAFHAAGWVRNPFFLAITLSATSLGLVVPVLTDAGLLQATSLPVIVTAASIGLAIHAIAPVTASALVAAGLLSVLAFPLTALSVIRAGRIEPATPPDPGDHGPPPAFDDQPVQKEG